MSELTPLRIEYSVTYTGWVRAGLRELVTKAAQLGIGASIIAALKDLDYRLRIYPQFGQPLRDMAVMPGQLCVGVVPPLVARYVLDEKNRSVSVGARIQVLPGFGL